MQTEESAVTRPKTWQQLLDGRCCPAAQRQQVHSQHQCQHKQQQADAAGRLMPAGLLHGQADGWLGCLSEGKSKQAHCGRSKNVGSKLPRRTAGASTRLATSGTRSCLQLSGTVPETCLASASTAPQICSRLCWPSRRMPAPCHNLSWYSLAIKPCIGRFR